MQHHGFVAVLSDSLPPTSPELVDYGGTASSAGSQPPRMIGNPPSLDRVSADLRSKRHVLEDADRKPWSIISGCALPPTTSCRDF